MLGVKYILLMISVSSNVGATPDCSQKNKSCGDIKQGGSYVYSHDCPNGSKIYVSENETAIARTHPKPGYTREGMKINNTSFVMKECNSLRIRCTYTDRTGRANDFCWDYNISEPPESPTSPPVTQTSKQDHITTGQQIGIGLGTGLFVLIGIAVAGYCCVFKSCCQGKQLEQIKVQPEGVEVQGDPDSKMDNNRNTIQLNEVRPADGACDENEKNSTLESVKVQSAEETPQNLSLNHIVESDEETQTKDGGPSVPDAAPTCRDMQRNLRGDPGGMNGNKTEDIVGNEEMQNGWTLGGRGPKEVVTEREPLLPVQRAAIQPSNMSGEAKVLVDKSCFDPGPISRCSNAQDTDVESAKT